MKNKSCNRLLLEFMLVVLFLSVLSGETRSEQAKSAFDTARDRVLEALKTDDIEKWHAASDACQYLMASTPPSLPEAVINALLLNICYRNSPLISDIDNLAISESQLVTGTVGKMPCAVRKLVFSPKGDVFVSIHKNACVHLWNATTLAHIAELTGTWDDCIDAVFSVDGRFLTLQATDPNVYLWNAADGRLLRTYDPGDSIVDTVCLSNNGEILAAGTGSRITFFNTASDAKIGEVLYKEGEVKAMSFCRSDAELITHSGHATDWFGSEARYDLWDVKSGKCLKSSYGFTSYKSGPDVPRLIVFEKEGVFLDASVNGIVRVKLDDLSILPGCSSKQEFEGELPANDDDIVLLSDSVEWSAICSDSEWLVLTARELIHVANGKERKLMRLPEGEANFVSGSLSKNGKTVTVIDSQGVLRWVDVASGMQVLDAKLKGVNVDCLKYSDVDGSLLLCADNLELRRIPQVDAMVYNSAVQFSTSRPETPSSVAELLRHFNTAQNGNGDVEDPAVLRRKLVSFFKRNYDSKDLYALSSMWWTATALADVAGEEADLLRSSAAEAFQRGYSLNAGASPIVQVSIVRDSKQAEDKERYIFARNASNHLNLWSPKTGENVYRFTECADMRLFATNPSNNLSYMFFGNGNIMRWCFESGSNARIGDMESEHDPVQFSVSDTAWNEMLLTADGKIFINDTELPGTPGKPSCVTISKNGSFAAAGDDKGNVSIWSIRDKKIADVGVVKAGDGTVTSLDFLSENLGMFAVIDGKTLATFGLKDAAKVNTVSIPAGVDKIAFNAGRTHFALIDGNGMTSIWSPEPEKHVWVPDLTRSTTIETKERARSVALSDDARIVTIGLDSGIEIYDWNDARSYRKVITGVPVTAIAYGALDTLLIGCADGKVRLVYLPALPEKEQ